MTSPFIRHAAAAGLLLLAAGAHAGPGASAQPSSQLFSVFIDGAQVSRITAVEFLKGADRPVLAGAVSTATFRLTQSLAGVTGSASEFLKWRQGNIGKGTDQRNVTLVLLDSRGTESGRIEFTRCAALAWNGPALAADGSAGSVVESVDVACQQASMSGGF